MNATQLEEAKKRGQHVTPKHEERGHVTCWCGLCHCNQCQQRRADTTVFQ